MPPASVIGDKSARAAGVAANEFALVFAGDDAYAPGLAVAMHSALANLAPAARPEVWVLDSGLSESSRIRLERVVRAARSIDDVRWVQTPKERLAPVAVGSWFTPATYSRLLIPEVVPRHIRRAVYLDADVLVRRDISPLFTIDLRGAPTGAVRDFKVASTGHEWSGVRERAHPKPYFNAGVLVIDVARWRLEGVGERALRYASAGEPLVNVDQDALNALDAPWHELDFRWNVQEHRRRNLFVERKVFVGKRIPYSNTAEMERRLQRKYGDLGRTAWILQFMGSTKPWQHRCLTPGTAAWARTFLRTGWYTPREAMTWLLRRHGARVRYRLGTARRQGSSYVRQARQSRDRGEPSGRVSGVQSRGRGRVGIPLSRVLHEWPGVRGLSRTLAHFVGHPALHQIDSRSSLLTMSAEEAAEAILGECVGYTQEYEHVREQIARQFATADLRYPSYFAVEEATAYLLYMLVRHVRPSQTLEIGVADGRSTQIILSALDANDHGSLISVDIEDEVGGAARGHPRWQLHVRSPGPPASRELEELLADIGPPDLFFHDAMHTYHDQYADYLVALDHMLPGSLFVSDDVDYSWAFLDITGTRLIRPVVLVDRRKALGAFVLPGERA